jgi:CRP/FNR family transcriptional regulator, cyclic AMP receptor protein
MNADLRERIDQLKSLALLRHLPEASLPELARVLKVQTVPAGDLVFEEGSAGDTMFLLALGQVRIEKQLEAGGFAELALLSPGDVFGEMALIERLPRSARAVAHTDATLFALARPELERWLASEPMMAVGLFVELLRVLSHRLRRSSRELVLLHDVGDLAVRRFDDEAEFLGAVLPRLTPHLEGDWSAAAYVYNEFNDEVVRVGTVGPHRGSLPATLPIGEAASRWLDSQSLCVALGGKADTPIGFLVARNEVTMSPSESAEIEIALAAVGHLVASALQNIRHDIEERLRARLQDKQALDSSL